MVRFVKVFIFLLLMAGIHLQAQQITVKAVTDTAKFKVGDYINYRLEFSYDKNIKIEYPSVKDSIKNLDFIKEMLPAKHESSSKVMETRTYVFSKYDSSIVKTPSFKIFYSDDKNRNYLTVNSITLIVEKIAVDTSKEILDVKPPVEIPFNWVLALIIFGIIVLLAITGYFVYAYYKKKNAPKEKPAPPIPPYELALLELKALDEKQLWQNGKVKEYHSEITEIVRKYFEFRFGFLALEMTTSEVLASLQTSNGGEKVKDLTEKFLSNADLVKFAKFVPIPSLNSEMMEQAVKIVKTAKPAEQEPQKKEGENV